MSEFEFSMEEALKSVVDVNVGDLVQGEVISIQDNKQAIVSIVGNGVEGVVPFKELTATPEQYDNITDLVTIGDILDLVVIAPIKDKENGNYLLSKKRVDAKKVWAEIQEQAERGELLEGVVKDAVKGGLVVDVGVRAFVPASMVAERYVADLSPYKGQTLRFKVVEIEPSENRLILSRKEVVAAEKREKLAEILSRIEEGSVVEGVVTRLTNFGAFIDLGGVDGLVHVSEISHLHVKNPAAALKVGETVSVKVLSIDPERERISLSIKATTDGPWANIEEKVVEGQVLTGVVKRLTSFGAFVELFPGVEGLVHISQISHEHIATPHEVLTPEQEVQVQVRELKVAEQRISLSIKALIDKPAPEKAVEEEAVEPEATTEEEPYDVNASDVNVTLGDLLGDQLSSLSE